MRSYFIFSIKVSSFIFSIKVSFGGGGGRSRSGYALFMNTLRSISVGRHASGDSDKEENEI